MHAGDSGTAPSAASHCAGVFATIESACTGLRREEEARVAGRDLAHAAARRGQAVHSRSIGSRASRERRSRLSRAHPSSSAARVALTSRCLARSFCPSKTSETTITLKCDSDPLGTLCPDDSLMTCAAGGRCWRCVGLMWWPAPFLWSSRSEACASLQVRRREGRAQLLPQTLRHRTCARTHPPRPPRPGQHLRV